jgi:hypothetical protein
MTSVEFVSVDPYGTCQSKGSSVDEDLHTRPMLDYFDGGIGEQMRIEGF